MSGVTKPDEVDENVAIFDIRHFARADVSEVHEFLESAYELSQRPDVDAGVIRLPDDGAIAGEVFDLVEEYGQFFVGAGIERVGLVSGDVKNIALKSRLRVDGMEVEALDDVDSAVAWARGDG